MIFDPEMLNIENKWRNTNNKINQAEKMKTKNVQRKKPRSLG